jgi:hypothetical protein
MTVRGQVVRADELRPGDRIILPMIGPRRVLTVTRGEVGLTGVECIDVVYSTGGGGTAYENKGTAHGPARTQQAEAGLKPLRPDEPVAIEPRGDASPLA